MFVEFDEQEDFSDENLFLKALLYLMVYKNKVGEVSSKC